MSEGSYKVLYRKYRPMFFADVVGQPQVTVTLKNQLAAGRVSHAYLFTGTRGTGKTTCAKILAKAVNCLNPNEGDPCGECEICRGLDEGSILDVVEIDAASNNGVDSIRSLIEESNFTPASAKYRVYIIDEVHMLSVAAFNALLKTLEEPPAHVIFILATTEVHKLLPTILSRCQRFDFKRITPDDIAQRLEEVCAKEGATIDNDAAVKIARIADGGMRDALSILDQCLGRNSHVTIEIVNETAGVVDKKYLQTLASTVTSRDSGTALGLISELYEGSKDMSRLCEEMADYFRGMMIARTTKNPAAILRNDSEELEAITTQAEKMSLSEIVHGLDTFEQTLNKMRFANQRTELEMAFVRLCSPELDTSLEALARRLEALESGVVKTTAKVVAQSTTAEPLKDEAASAKQTEEAPLEREMPRAPMEREMPEFVKAAQQQDDAIVSPEPTEIEEEESIETTIELINDSSLADDESENELSVEVADSFDATKDEDAPSENITLVAEIATESDAAEAQEKEEPEPQLEGQVTLGGEEVDASGEAPKEESSPESLVGEAAPFEAWSSILENMRGKAPKMIIAAFDGSKAYESGEYMLIDAPQIAFNLLKKADFRVQMREAIREVTGKVYKLGPYVKKAVEVEKEDDPLDMLIKKVEDAGIETE